jgi:hypothetical protein
MGSMCLLPQTHRIQKTSVPSHLGAPVPWEGVDGSFLSPEYIGSLYNSSLSFYEQTWVTKKQHELLGNPPKVTNFPSMSGHETCSIKSRAVLDSPE